MRQGTYKVRAQECISTTSRSDGDSNCVSPLNKRPLIEFEVINFAEPTVSATRHTPRIEIGGGSGGVVIDVVHGGLRAAAGEGEGGADAEGGGTDLVGGEVEFYGYGTVYGGEDCHGEFGDGGAVDVVGYGAPV